MLNRAIEAFQAGQLNEAEKLLNIQLSSSGKHFSAQYILGLVLLEQGRAKEAILSLKKAEKLNASDPSLQYNLAKALSTIERDSEALLHHKLAIQLQPNNSNAWLNYSVSLAKLRMFQEAITVVDRAIELNPNLSEAYLSKGAIYNSLKQFNETVIQTKRAVKLNPQLFVGWFNQAVALTELSNFSEALISYDRAIAIRPDYCEAWSNRGIVLSHLGEHAQALISYDRAIAIRPDYCEAWSNKGVALNALRSYQEALLAHDQALAIDPLHVQAWSNKGVTLNELRRYDEALLAYDQALAIDPLHVQAWSNKGVTLNELRRYDEALLAYDQVLSIDPQNIDANWNASFANLILGRYKIGWTQYEYRKKKKEIAVNLYSQIPVASSLVEVIGKKLLVWSEQGFGDIIQFSRYIHLLKKSNVDVTFEVPKPLEDLMRHSYPGSQIRRSGISNSDVDYQISVLSLPKLFGTELQSIPINNRYLGVDNGCAMRWRDRINLLCSKGLKIGIACSGRLEFDQKYGNKRPISLEQISRLNKYGNLFLIQKDIRPADQDYLKNIGGIHDMSSEINDFNDTAAIADCMDVIVSIDTSMLHLAGALAKPTCGLLSCSPDWRWLESGVSSPWYSSITLFRQEVIGEWGDVLLGVEGFLSKFTHSVSSHDKT